MDDIKLFAKNEKEQEVWIQTIGIYIQDIWMECDIEKYVILLMRNWKRGKTKKIKLPNQKRIRTFWGKENYLCLEILEVDPIKKAEMKEKLEKSSLEKIENW